MIDDMVYALQILKEYCENYKCYSCMLYKPETGCFFKYHDIPAPHKWEPESIYDIDNSDEE